MTTAGVWNRRGYSPHRGSEAKEEAEDGIHPNWACPHDLLPPIRSHLLRIVSPPTKH